MIETLVPPLQRGLLFAGVLMLAAVPIWRAAIAPAAARRLDDGARRIGALEAPAARLGLWVSVGLVGVWGLRMYVQLLGFRDPFVPLREDLAFLIFETFWGTVWMAQGGLFLALAVGFGLAARRAPDELDTAALPHRWRLLLAGVVLVALTLALSSHAMSVESNRPLAVALDAAHVLAAGGWMGSLALILILHRAGNGGASRLAAQLRAFSPVAMVSVGVLLFAGLLLATQHVGTFGNLWGSRYGRTFMLKLTIVAGVLALGAVNWRRGLPSLDTAEGRARTHRRAWFEVGAALAVLAVTAVLTGTAMPGGGH